MELYCVLAEGWMTRARCAPRRVWISHLAGDNQAPAFLVRIAFTLLLDRVSGSVLTGNWGLKLSIEHMVVVRSMSG